MRIKTKETRYCFQTEEESSYRLRACVSRVTKTHIEAEAESDVQEHRYLVLGKSTGWDDRGREYEEIVLDAAAVGALVQAAKELWGEDGIELQHPIHGVAHSPDPTPRYSQTAVLRKG